MSNSNFNNPEILQLILTHKINYPIVEAIDCYFEQCLRSIKNKIEELARGIKDPKKLDVTFNRCSSDEETVELIKQTLNIWEFVYDCLTAEQSGFLDFITENEKNPNGDKNKIDLNESYLKPRLESVSKMINVKKSAINILASGQKLSEEQLNVIEEYDQKVKSWEVYHKAFETKRILSDDMLKKIELFDCNVVNWEIYHNCVEMKDGLTDDVKKQIEKYNQEIKWWSIYNTCLSVEQESMPDFIEQRVEYIRERSRLLIRYGDSVVGKL